MTWAQERVAVVATIEALTPGSLPSSDYRYVQDQDIDDASKLRMFDFRMVMPPRHANANINGVHWRWETEAELKLFYPKLAKRWQQEDIIAADTIQLQKALLVKGGHHDSAETTTADQAMPQPALEDAGDGKRFLIIPFTIAHTD